jgi:hypothetical protein
LLPIDNFAHGMPLTSESRRTIPARIGQAPEKAMPTQRVSGGSLARGRSGQKRDGAETGLVASLRQSLAEKESALQRASLTAFQLRKQLDQAGKQLDLAGKQNDTLRRQAEAAAIEGWGAATGSPRQRRIRGPAVGIEATRLPESALAELARDRSREMRARLIAGVLPITVVAAIWGIWSQIPQPEFLKNARPVAVAAGAKSHPPRAGADVDPDLGSASDNGSGKADARPGARFNQALNRLNNVLLYSPAPPQQLLNAARQRGLNLHRNVCDFSWNGGQPALLYHDGLLIYTHLDDCASAVESYLYGKKEAPTANGRGD